MCYHELYLFILMVPFQLVIFRDSVWWRRIHGIFTVGRDLQGHRSAFGGGGVGVGGGGGGGVVGIIFFIPVLLYVALGDPYVSLPTGDIP